MYFVFTSAIFSHRTSKVAKLRITVSSSLSLTSRPIFSLLTSVLDIRIALVFSVLIFMLHLTHAIQVLVTYLLRPSRASLTSSVKRWCQSVPVRYYRGPPFQRSSKKRDGNDRLPSFNVVGLQPTFPFA